MKKIFINQDILFGFRVPILNGLSKKAEITLYSKEYSKKIDRRFNFTFKPILSIGKKLIFQFINPNEVKKFDVVILIFDTRIISNLLLHAFCKINHVPVIYWGIGYGKGYFSNLLRDLILKYSDGLILYNKKSEFKFRAKNKKLPIFVCNNTVEKSDFPVAIKVKKTGNLMFVGALESRKGIPELLIDLSRNKHLFNKLYIIGDGPEKHNLNILIEELGIGFKVEMVGHLNDYKKLYVYYKQCDFSVSLRQAGLSVQQSMLFATPFVCYENCISGGEVESILDGSNGYILGHDNKFPSFVNFLEDYSVQSDDSLHSMSSSAINTYKAKFSDESMILVIEKAYLKACND